MTKLRYINIQARNHKRKSLLLQALGFSLIVGLFASPMIIW